MCLYFCFILTFSEASKSNLMKCATDILSGLQADCQPQETIMVGTTLQNMMGAYEGVCKFKYDVSIS